MKQLIGNQKPLSEKAPGDGCCDKSREVGQIERREFIKKTGIVVAIGLAAALPFVEQKSETVPRNSQMSFTITAQPKMEG